MANARNSSSKRKGSKIGQSGGLGGPGGRGGSRKSLRPRKGGTSPDLSNDVLQMKPRDLAATLARRANRNPAEGATPYRTAMTALSSYANRHSRTLSPEVRTKLAKAKDELRELFDQQHEGKGKGAPGKKYEKPKAQSRRNPTAKLRAKSAGQSARGGSHKAGGR